MDVQTSTIDVRTLADSCLATTEAMLKPGVKLTADVPDNFIAFSPQALRDLYGSVTPGADILDSNGNATTADNNNGACAGSSTTHDFSCFDEVPVERAPAAARAEVNGLRRVERRHGEMARMLLTEGIAGVSATRGQRAACIECP